MIGTLGNFEITSQIGKGGMGVVYRAKDQKLGRDVAIKILPEEFAKDADRVARFQREAKLLASLNHPNIAAIYGLEESDSTHFLVLELVEGDTLADRIKEGPIPVEESLKLALQIAEALEAAHEKGIIHRDLKPANIKVTPEGKVKVLDFGLAKVFAGDQVEVNLSHSPTLSEAATLQGVILGTAAYMSPEQAKGKTVDKKTDIWAFGAVLYEILTGKAAFQGDEVSEILASVIKGDINLDLLPTNIHPRVREVITRCLQKDLKDRYRDIGDAQFEIRQVLADPSGVFIQPVTKVKPRKKLRVGLPWVAAAIVLTAIISGIAIWNLKPPEPRRVTRFDHDLPEGQQLSTLAVSPDGKQFVYGTPGGLYLRSMDELDARFIPGTDENPQDAFFSPDGQWIGYVSRADGQLKKISINGGAPVVLADSAHGTGASWSKDNFVVYYARGKGIMRVSANGGTPEKLVEPEGIILVTPQILPDGKTLLFAFVTGNKNQILVQSLESGKRKVLFEGECVRYLPTGHLIYMVRNTLFAIAFDLDRLEVAGGPVPLVESVFRMSHTSAPHYAVSDSGTLVYMPGTTSAVQSNQRTLVWVDREGKEEPIEVSANAYDDPRISPDGTRVALEATFDDNQDIWIWDLVRETLTRLTFHEALDFRPLWTPDSKRIVFSSLRDYGYYVSYWKAADGTGDVEKLASVQERNIIPSSLSSDGKTLLTFDQGNTYDIGMLSMEGDHEWKPLLQEDYIEQQPQISPDGRWMAYDSNESGRFEVYVRPFPEVDKERWQVSTKGGKSPRWSPDGKELFYLSSDAVMAVSVETEPTFKPSKPKMLFPGNYIGGYDIHPDGKRFLMMKPLETTDDKSTTEAEAPRKINIVLNWFKELKERVPID